jgi:hypothetical protein
MKVSTTRTFHAVHLMIKRGHATEHFNPGWKQLWVSALLTTPKMIFKPV